MDENQKLNHKRNVSYDSIQKYLTTPCNENLSRGSFYEKEKKYWDEELKRSSFRRNSQDITLTFRYNDNTGCDESDFIFK